MIVGGIAGGIGAGIGTGAIGRLSGLDAVVVGGMASGAINGGGMTAVYGGSFSDVMAGMTQGAVVGGFAGALSYGANSFFGDFSGVEGGGIKNAMYELRHSALKGGAQDLAGGAMLSVINQDASYLWKGAAFGAGFGAGMATLKIAAFGPYAPSMADNFENLEDHGQKYRRGWYKRGGITIGKTVSVRPGNSVDGNEYLMRHEIAHVADINKVGALRFYLGTAGHYIKYGIGGSHYIYGTYEWRADQSVFEQGYYIPFTTVH